MFRLNRLLTVRILAALLVLFGLVALYTDVARELSAVQRVVFDGPLAIGAKTLSLQERHTAAGTFVDIVFGDDVITGTEAVMVVPDAATGTYTQRYGTRFALLQSAGSDGLWNLLEVSPDPAGHRRIELHKDGSQRVVFPHQHDLTRRSLLPAPTLVLLGIALFIMRGLPPARAATPTLLLVLLTAAGGAVLAWPIMLKVGIAQSLPAAVLGLGVTALVALAAGPRAQRWLSGQPHARRALRGAVIACLLLGVLVAVTVNIQGFIAPVFRPPGQTLSPGEWFMQDFIMPTFALTALGTLPAVVGGAIYGLSLRATPITNG